MGRTALVGLAGLVVSGLVARLLLGATGGAGVVEVAITGALSIVVGASAALAAHRRAMARRPDAR